MDEVYKHHNANQYLVKLFLAGLPSRRGEATSNQFIEPWWGLFLGVNWSRSELSLTTIATAIVNAVERIDPRP